MELKGRRVLITGAGRGIGHAVARRFAEAGCHLVLVDRDESSLTRVAGELDGTAHRADLADPAAVTALIGEIEADAGAIDVLVNNAGIGVAQHITDFSAAELR